MASAFRLLSKRGGGGNFHGFIRSINYSSKNRRSFLDSNINTSEYPASSASANYSGRLFSSSSNSNSSSTPSDSELDSNSTPSDSCRSKSPDRLSQSTDTSSWSLFSVFNRAKAVEAFNLRLHEEEKKEREKEGKDQTVRIECNSGGFYMNIEAENTTIGSIIGHVVIVHEQTEVVHENVVSTKSRNLSTSSHDRLKE